MKLKTRSIYWTKNKEVKGELCVGDKYLDKSTNFPVVAGVAINNDS